MPGRFLGLCDRHDLLYGSSVIESLLEHKGWPEAEEKTI